MPVAYLGCNRPVPCRVRGELGGVEVEPAAGAVVHGNERAAAHSVADLVG
jgi:hypothetical protein